MGRYLHIMAVLLGALGLAYGCGGGVSQQGANGLTGGLARVQITLPGRDTTVVSGSVVDARWAMYADSCEVYFGTERIAGGMSQQARIDTKSRPLGVQHVRVMAWRNGKVFEKSRRVTILAASAPQEFSYRTVGEFPHDEDAYTQGLIFANGFLYESTGQRGASSVRRVEMATGRVLQVRNLPGSEFGEGLTLHGGALYQLTWTSHRCHVYDLSTFTPIKELYYNTQGWGLASDGKFLYMTDGTENIYVLDPGTFSVIRTIQAYTHEGPQRMLNELEFIEGLLYANVYLTDEIVAIDPDAGTVMRRIHLDGLLPDRYRTSHVEVLNGIAYDPTRGAIYLTGKYWPKLYQVSFVAR